MSTDEISNFPIFKKRSEASLAHLVVDYIKHMQADFSPPFNDIYANRPLYPTGKFLSHVWKQGQEEGKVRQLGSKI